MRFSCYPARQSISKATKRFLWRPRGTPCCQGIMSGTEQCWDDGDSRAPNTCRGCSELCRKKFPQHCPLLLSFLLPAPIYFFFHCPSFFYIFFPLLKHSGIYLVLSSIVCRVYEGVL